MSTGYCRSDRVGLVQRVGPVILLTVENAKTSTLMPHLTKRILPQSIVCTDEWTAYRHLGHTGCDHRRINHSEGVYVSGDIHTKTIEGFWSLVKSGIRGSHHAASAKYLPGYLNEYTWRYNHRHERRSMFELFLSERHNQRRGAVWDLAISASAVSISSRSAPESSTLGRSAALAPRPCGPRP